MGENQITDNQKDINNTDYSTEHELKGSYLNYLLDRNCFSIFHLDCEIGRRKMALFSLFPQRRDPRILEL